MAQCPWQVVEKVDIDIWQALKFARGCSKDLSRHLTETKEGSLLISNIANFIESLGGCTPKLSQPDNSGIGEPPTSDKASLRARKRHRVSATESVNNSLLSTCFTKIHARGTVQLHPCYLQNVAQGIRVFLSNFLLKYVPEFRGIWVAYYPKIICSDSVGYVSEAERFAIMTFQIELSCLVFSPSLGDVIALLVHGLFNACIRLAGLEPRYEFTNGVFESKKASSMPIKPGALVAMQVCRLHNNGAGDLINIECSMKDSNCTGVLDPETLVLP